MPEPAPSLTGVPLADQVVPAAQRAVWAVREGDQAALAAAERQAAQLAGGQVAGLRLLAMVLAAMVPDDQAPADLLAWCAHPEEYLRLRAAGVGAIPAAALAVRARQEEAA